MAGEIIRPKDLTPRPTPVASELMVVDNSVNVGAATIKAIVEAGRPAASQAEAQTGTDAVKAMTPLTTKQSIAAEVGLTLASKAQGDLAATAVQPENLATVATSGAYADLAGKPILGTSAATDASAYATSTQGGKADTALQSVVPGANVAIDNTDPRNPVVSASSGGGLGVAEDRTVLKGMNTAAVTTVYLKETGREGQFVWKTGDYSSQIATDALEGIFVKATATAATAGAWVRQFDSPVHARWFGASLQIAVNVAAMLGKSLYLGGKGTTHTITSTLTIPADLMVYSQLFGGAGAKINASSGNFTAVTLGQRVKLVGVEIEGPGNNAYHVDSFGIFQTGTNNAPAAPTYVDGPTIDNCYIHGFRNAGIELRYVDKFAIRHSRVDNSGYMGILGVSVRNGDVYETTVDGVSPGTAANAYGIALTKFNGDQVGYPKSRDVSVRNCEVKNVPAWHAFDTHGGDRIVFSDCIARNCKRGFVVTAGSDAAGGRYASKQSGFVRCVAIEGLATHTEKGQAFWLIGANNASSVIVDFAEDCFMENCFADGYGQDGPGGSGPVLSLEGVRRLRIDGLTMINSVGRGILFGKDCLEFSIDGLTISDIYSNYRDTIAIGFNGNNIKGRIRDYNFINTGTTPGSFRNNIGFYSASSLTGLQVSLSSGRNLSATPTSYGTALSAYDA